MVGADRRLKLVNARSPFLTPELFDTGTELGLCSPKWSQLSTTPSSSSCHPSGEKPELGRQRRSTLRHPLVRYIVHFQGIPPAIHVGTGLLVYVWAMVAGVDSSKEFYIYTGLFGVGQGMTGVELPWSDKQRLPMVANMPVLITMKDIAQSVHAKSSKGFITVSASHRILAHGWVC